MTLTQFVAEAGGSDEIDRALDRRHRTWLDALAEVRVDRTRNREEMTAEMQVRAIIETVRYESYYDIDLSDRSIYDLVVNTGRWTPAGTLEIVLSALREYDPTVDEGAFRTPELEI